MLDKKPSVLQQLEVSYCFYEEDLTNGHLHNIHQIAEKKQIERVSLDFDGSSTSYVAS